MSGDINITFLRHGRSRADDENVIEGRYDSPLTDTGRAQAQRRGDDLKKRGFLFDAIVASTLSRAAETARIIGETLGVVVEPDADWMEADNGPVAGMSHEEAQAKYPLPEFQNPFDPFVVSAGEGESSWALQCRAVRALEKVIRRGPGSYLVVAHGGILGAAMRCVVGTQPPLRGQGISFSFGDTGYIRTRYRPGRHHWTIQDMKPGE